MAQAGLDTSVPAIAAEPPAQDARTATLHRALLVVAVGLALLPIAAGTARALHNHWLPIGDNSIVYARTTDVFTADTPLLYMWSAGSGWAEEAFNNPGPMLYWVFAGPVAVLGPSGMAVATALLNAAAVLGLAIVGRRLGGPLVAVAALAVAATLSWTMGSTLLADPWPPNSLLLVTVLYLALVWSAVDGDIVALPWAAGVGSMLVQTNLSYALLAPGLGLFAAGAVALHLLRRRRRDPDQWPALARRARRVTWSTAAVLVVAWAPTIVEQLTADDTGNLTRIARAMGEQPLSVGAGRALRLVAGIVALPSWLSRHSFTEVYTDTPSTAAAVAVAVLAAAVLGGLTALAVRLRDRMVVAGLATAACALLLGFLTTARSPIDGFGDLAGYRTRFLWAVVAFVGLVVVVAAARCVLRGATAPLVGTGVLVGVIAVAAVANLGPHWVVGGNHEPTYANKVVRELRAQLADLDADQTVLFDWRGDSANYPFWAYAVIAELIRQGVPLKVHDPLLVRTLGEQRRYDGDGDADVLMTVRTGDDAHRVPPGARRIAMREALRPAELDELRTLRADLVHAIDRGEVRLTPEAERTLARLDKGRLEADERSQGRLLVEGRHIPALLGQGFLDLDAGWESRIWRYLGLEDRSDDRTVGVFVRPLGRQA